MADENKISIVVPILNEKDNIVTLLSEFDDLVSQCGLTALDEVIFVDDGSKDGTVDILKRHSQLQDFGHRYKITLLERDRKLGQVDACIAGSRLATNGTIAVMDSDLQHPPLTLTKMSSLMNGTVDIIAASRHIVGGKRMWSPMRGVVSRVAILIAYIFVKPSRKLKDPTTGYFMTRKEYITGLPPLAKRTKLLLYILSKNPDLKVMEVPYTFKDRKAGESKTVTKSPSFIIDYLIEILSYMRVGYRSKKAIKKSTDDIVAFRTR